MIHILLYVFICIAILAVVEILRSDDPKVITKNSLKNFFILTGIFVGGTLVLSLIQLLF